MAGIAVELVLAATLVYLPLLHPIFGTAAPSPAQLAVVLPYPFVVWGADEARRWVQRHRTHPPTQLTPVDASHRQVSTRATETPGAAGATIPAQAGGVR